MEISYCPAVCIDSVGSTSKASFRIGGSASGSSIILSLLHSPNVYAWSASMDSAVVSMITDGIMALEYRVAPWCLRAEGRTDYMPWVTACNLKACPLFPVSWMGLTAFFLRVPSLCILIYSIKKFRFFNIKHSFQYFLNSWISLTT